MSLEASSFFRNSLAVVAGLGVGSAVNMGLITINTSYLFPMPSDISFEDTEKFGEYIASLPPLAYIMVFLAHYGQAVVGGLVAARLATNKESGDACCYVIGALTMIGSIMNTIALPVPAWTWVEIPVFPILAFYTAQWAAPSKGSKDA